MPPRIPANAVAKLRLGRTSCPSSISRVVAVPRVQPTYLLNRRHITTTTSTTTTTIAAPTTTTTTISQPYISFTSSDRLELKSTLLNLQKVAGNYINLSRLQLALRGLDQPAGEETIRIAIHGLGLTHQDGRQLTKELVRLLIADPLVQEEEWERTLMEQDSLDERPILLKIGPDEHQLYVSSNRLVKEIYISSPILNNYQLELLILQSDHLPATDNITQTQEAILVPTVEIPTSNTGRYTPVTTPVHRAVVLGSGIRGAATLVALSEQQNTNDIITALSLPAYAPESRKEQLPFQLVDILQAKAALASFRKSVNNALEYERNWFDSGLPSIVDFIKDVKPSSAAPTQPILKAPVASLISDIVSQASIKIQNVESHHHTTFTSSKVPLQTLDTLRSNLNNWSRRSHTELRDTLETAFHGRRWRSLNWWKLFWRVDDISMITSDMLSQRFLPEAEKEIIFLAGKIDQAGVSKNLAAMRANVKGQNPNWAYKILEETTPVIALGTLAPDAQLSDILPKPTPEEGTPSLKLQPWPLDIPLARTHLSQTTIPALQALAQKLLLQTMSTSGFATAFSALIYVSDGTTSIYEAGAVAALGIVWSLRRLQTRWEGARAFWEDEVREEGRRAIGAVEASVQRVLRVPSVEEVGTERNEFQEALKAAGEVEKALAKVQGKSIRP